MLGELLDMPAHSPDELRRGSGLVQRDELGDGG
jgi:hypothetical protein